MFKHQHADFKHEQFQGNLGFDTATNLLENADLEVNHVVPTATSGTS